MKDPDSNGGRLTNLARRWRKRLTQAQPEAGSQETFFPPPWPPKGSSDVATATAAEPGLGGKVLTQVVSLLLPPGATTFSALAEKFGYSVMRDVIFSNIREFYPDIAAHYIHKHREKVARMAANDAAQSLIQSGVR
jgi:hypothetical protein